MQMPWANDDEVKAGWKDRVMAIKQKRGALNGPLFMGKGHWDGAHLFAQHGRIALCPSTPESPQIYSGIVHPSLYASIVVCLWLAYGFSMVDRRTVIDYWHFITSEQTLTTSTIPSAWFGPFFSFCWLAGCSIRVMSLYSLWYTNRHIGQYSHGCVANKLHIQEGWLRNQDWLPVAGPIQRSLLSIRTDEQHCHLWHIL